MNVSNERSLKMDKILTNNTVPNTEWSITKIACTTVPSEYDGKPVNIRLYIKTYNRLTFKRTSENKLLNAILKLLPWNRVWEVRNEYHANIETKIGYYGLD